MHGPGMSEAKPSVVIIDDDAEFRDSVVRLLRSVGLDIQQFSSVADFSKAKLSDGPTCLVLDVRMPGRSGLELQRDLAAANRQVPIIFITAHADVPMTVQAMKGGAIEFLTKPFRDQELLDAVEAGLARDRARRESDRALDALKERFATLRACSGTIAANGGLRSDGVVPVAVELVAKDVDGVHLVIGDFDACRIGVPINFGSHF